MAAITHITSSWVTITGRLVAAVLGAGVVLFATYLLCMAIGLLQYRHIQIVTFEPYESARWSIHFLGVSVEDSEPLFRFLCLLLLLPSLTIGALVWRHFGRRWKGRHGS